MVQHICSHLPSKCVEMRKTERFVLHESLLLEDSEVTTITKTRRALVLWGLNTVTYLLNVCLSWGKWCVSPKSWHFKGNRWISTHLGQLCSAVLTWSCHYGFTNESQEPVVLRKSAEKRTWCCKNKTKKNHCHLLIPSGQHWNHHTFCAKNNNNKNTWLSYPNAIVPFCHDHFIV